MSKFPCLDAHQNLNTSRQRVEALVPFKLQETLDRYGVSGSIFFQAVWAILLRSYCGSDAVAFGNLFPWALDDTRSSYECELRTVLFEAQSTVEIWREMKSTQARNLGGQFSTESLKQNQTTFNTAVYCEEISRHSEALEPEELFEKFTTFESCKNVEILLGISVCNTTTFTVHLNYLGGKWSTVAATNIAHTFSNIVSCILHNPEKPIAEYDLCTRRDLEQVRIWNENLPDRRDVLVHELVFENAKLSPQSPAICSWDGSLTYEQLDRTTSVLADHLVSLGILPEVMIPVCFEKSMFAIIAMITILKVGGVFVPLDPSHPKDRLEKIIRKTKASLVIGSPQTSHLFDDMEVQTLVVTRCLLESVNIPVTPRIVEVRPYNAGFVLFSSGSTGEPKGIVQEHASICTSSLAHGKAMNITSKSRVLQYAAYTFDVSMMDIFTTLIFGGVVCTPSEDARTGNITGTINAMEVNWALFTPSFANLITPEEVPTLKTLALGGEAVTTENVTRWAHKVSLYNCYGPCECAAFTINIILPNTRPGNIGRPFGCGICWVTDPNDHNRLLPIGAIGELCVEGATLARGYLDDTARTKSSFIKNPNWPTEIAGTRTRRIYKTGDLVRQLSDGSFEFVGRKDLQVKVRGQRVELEEVEQTLSMLTGSKLCMVTCPKSGTYANSLVAIIELKKPATRMNSDSKLRLVDRNRFDAFLFNLRDLARLLGEKLPPYMVPNHWLVVEEIPLSTSQKIDRKKINHWLEGVIRPMEDLATRNRLHSGLVSQEADIALKVSRKIYNILYPYDSHLPSPSGEYDWDLSSLGLDSIQIISLRTFVKKEFGVNLNTCEFFRGTVRTISHLINEFQGQGRDQVVEEQAKIMPTFQRYKKEMHARSWSNIPKYAVVLLTGATGFLGTQLLFQLCTRDSIGKVIVHVRSKSIAHGIQRIRDSANMAGWWKENYMSKIEVWTGDLGQPRLGVSKDKWDRLEGNSSALDRITMVIHNGCTVHWNQEFSCLKAANVDSTLDLLKAIHEAPSVSKFVYISGGYHGTLQKYPFYRREDFHDDSPILPTGYAQTKFLSQLLVQEYAQLNSQKQQRVSIVKPGFIIGTVEEGIANVDDFLWRLVSTCIQIGGYNEVDSDCWLFVADVGHVAQTIVECCDPKVPSSAVEVDVADGLFVREFWKVLREDCGYNLTPFSQEQWMQAVYVDIDARLETHPLWPVMEILEQEKGRIGVPMHESCTGSMVAEPIRVKAAIRKNVEHLRTIGFFEGLPPKRAAFTRSRR